MNSKYTRLRLACYTSSISMSVVASLSPILFLTFRTSYGISYSLLGLLVLINFVPQLVGIMTDAAIAMPSVAELAVDLCIGAEQLGMKLGMLAGLIVPLCAIPLFVHLHRKA